MTFNMFQIKNAVGANHSQDLKIGYVPKCYLTKVPSLLDEVPALNRPSGNTQKLTPKPQKKSNQTFPNMVTKTEDKNDSKRSLGDESIAHKFRPPSLNQSVLKPSTGKFNLTKNLHKPADQKQNKVTRISMKPKFWRARKPARFLDIDVNQHAYIEFNINEEFLI